MKKTLAVLASATALLFLTSFESSEASPDQKFFGTETIVSDCQPIGNSGHGYQMVTTVTYFFGIKIKEESAPRSCAASIQPTQPSTGLD